MSVIALWLVCMVRLGHARRLQITSQLNMGLENIEVTNRSETFDPFNALQMVLLAFHPAAARSYPVFSSPTGNPTLSLDWQGRRKHSPSMNAVSDADLVKKETLDFRRQAFGLEHPHTLTAMIDYAISLRELGHLEEALPLSKEAWELAHHVLGPKRPDTLHALSNYAVTLGRLGHQRKAETLQKEVLAVTRRVLGPDHPDFAKAFGNYVEIAAKALADSGRRVKQLRKKLFELMWRVLGPEHPDTINALSNYAKSIIETLSQNGRPAEAAPLLKGVLDHKSRVLGLEHPDVLSAFNDHAFTLCSIGKAEVESLRESLERTRKVCGVGQPETLRALNNYAVTLSYLGHNAEAFEPLKEMLALTRKLHESGKKVEAEAVLEEAIQLRRGLLGSKHPDTLTALNTYAGMFRLEDSPGVESLKKVLDMTRRVLGPAQPETLRALNNYAIILSTLGHGAEAAPLMQDVLDTTNILAKLGRQAEAEALYEEVHKLRRDFLGAAHPDTRRAFNAFREQDAESSEELTQEAEPSEVVILDYQI